MSGNVDYIVAGENMGPAKLKKAEKLGVKIISEEEFMALVSGGASEGTEPVAGNGVRPDATAAGPDEPQQGALF